MQELAVVKRSARNPPPLPSELIQQIVEDAWHLPLTEGDRFTLLASLPLVNKMFLAIFNRLSITDVHIVTPSHAYHYLSLLRTRTSAERAEERLHPSLTMPPSALVNSLCRSITFHIPGGPGWPATLPIQLYREKHPMGQAMCATLYQLNRLSYTPALHRVCIAYTNWGYNDVFDQSRLIDLPVSVSALELHFKFSIATPPKLVNGLRARYFGRRRYGDWALLGVRELVVMGACPEFLVDTVQVCSELRVLETDEVQGLHALAPLPMHLHTLVLRPREGYVFDEKAFAEMQLTRAMVTGIFSCKIRARVVLETSGADLRVLEYATNICRNHHVDLIHRLRTDP